MELKLHFESNIYTITVSANESDSCQYIMDRAHGELTRSYQLILDQYWIQQSSLWLSKDEEMKGNSRLIRIILYNNKEQKYTGIISK